MRVNCVLHIYADWFRFYKPLARWWLHDAAAEVRAFQMRNFSLCLFLHFISWMQYKWPLRNSYTFFFLTYNFSLVYKCTQCLNLNIWTQTFFSLLKRKLKKSKLLLFLHFIGLTQAFSFCVVLVFFPQNSWE